MVVQKVEEVFAMCEAFSPLVSSIMSFVFHFLASPSLDVLNLRFEV